MQQHTDASNGRHSQSFSSTGWVGVGVGTFSPNSIKSSSDAVADDGSTVKRQAVQKDSSYHSMAYNNSNNSSNNNLHRIGPFSSCREPLEHNSDPTVARFLPTSTQMKSEEELLQVSNKRTAEGEVDKALTSKKQRIEPSLHFLLVDDTPTNRKMLAAVLMRSGVKSEMASHGQEGLEMVRQRAIDGHGPYDVIFMDNTMPILSGIDATQALRSGLYPNLIIGLTGNALDDDINEFLNAGADLVLPKPLRPEVLKSLLHYISQNGCKRSSSPLEIIDGFISPVGRK